MYFPHLNPMLDLIMQYLYTVLATGQAANASLAHIGATDPRLAGLLHMLAIALAWAVGY